MLGEHALDAERRETRSGVGKGQPVQRVHRVAVVGLALVAGLVALGAPLTTARAQVPGPHFTLDRGPLFSLPPPPIEELRTGGAGGAEALVALRLQHVRERRLEGAALLSLGVVGTLGGALVAVVGRDDPGLVAFGLVTASFGVINVPLGIGLLDLRHHARDEALDAGFLGMSAMTNPWDRLDGDREWSRSLPSYYARSAERRGLQSILRRRGAIHQTAPNLVTRVNVFGIALSAAGLFRRRLRSARPDTRAPAVLRADPTPATSQRNLPCPP